MGLIRRKSEGGISKGKAGAVGGAGAVVAGLIAAALTRVTKLPVEPELVIQAGGLLGSLIALWGIRDKQERVEG